MAYGNYRGKKGKKKGTSLRLTGLFKSKKKRGLAVGSITELDDLKDLLKKAIAEEKGLVVFLWRNEVDDDSDKKQPDFTLYMDVNQEDEDRPRRRKIEDDDDDEPRPRKKKPVEDDDDDEPAEKDDDDEVPF